MGLSLDELDSPLDDIAFLSRSNNRVAVLEALARDDQTRRELREATEVSRPTLGCVLDGFEERGWVANSGSGNGHDYFLTPLGQVVAEEFTETMATVETVQKLRDLAPQIPFDEATHYVVQNHGPGRGGERPQTVGPRNDVNGPSEAQVCVKIEIRCCD